MAVPSAVTTISGIVTSVNPEGMKLDGGAEWLNFSKFARTLVPPMRGQQVSAILDGQGFVRTVIVTGGPQETVQARQAPSGQRETVITRLAVLKRRLPNSGPAGPSSRAARS